MSRTDNIRCDKCNWEINRFASEAKDWFDVQISPYGVAHVCRSQHFHLCLACRERIFRRS